MEFLEFGFSDFRKWMDIEDSVFCVIGDIPGSVEGGTKDLGWKARCV